MMWWQWALIYAFFGIAAVLGSLDHLAEIEANDGCRWATGMAVGTFLLWPLALTVALFTKAFH